MSQFKAIIYDHFPYLKSHPSNGIAIHLTESFSRFWNYRRLQNYLLSRGLEKHVLLVKSLNQQTHHQLIQNSEKLSLLNLPLGSESLPILLKMAYVQRKPILIKKQIMDFEKSLRPYFVNASTKEHWHKHLNEKQSFKEQPELRISMDDAQGNQLNRIYNETIN